MNLETALQNDRLIKRAKRHCLFCLGFLALFTWFGLRLATAESPEEWKAAAITVADVRHISIRPYLWQILDVEGNAYTIGRSSVVNQILPQRTYQIVYSPNSDNGIRAVTQGDSVIVDYAQSVSVYCDRDVWDWLLALLGLAGCWTTIARMILDVRREIARRKSAASENGKT